MKHADLTEAQREALRDLERGRYGWRQTNPTMNALMRRGLVEWSTGVHPISWKPRSNWAITPAGRRALQESDPAKDEA